MIHDRVNDLIRLAKAEPADLLRDLVKYSAVPMGIVDAQSHRFVMVNDAFCHLLHYTEAELTSMNWADANHPDDVAPTTDWIARVQAGEISSYRIVKRYLTKDDGVVWGDLSVAALRRPDGSVWAYVGQIVDVSDRVRQDQALRDSEERFRLLAENSGDVVWHFDTDRIIEYVSPSVTRTLGWQPDELIGTHAYDLIHPGDLSPLPIEDLDRSGEVTSQLRYRCRDGSLRWCESHTMAIRQNEAVIGYTSTMRDVTAQVTAERALADSERAYRLIAENASDVVFRGTPKAVIEWVSPSLYTEFGVDPKDAIGQQVRDLIHPADAPIMLLASQSVNQGERVTYRARIRTGDDQWRWVEVTAKPVRDDAGAVVARIGSMRNLEDQVRAERALEQAKEQALGASLAKTAFLSQMSHELRTPLNAVLGFAQLLAMDELSPDQQEAVEQIRIGGKHLLDIINEVLDISRIEAGRLSLSLEAIDIDEVAGEAMDLVRALADRHDVELAPFVGSGRYAWADRQRTIQIVVNLLTNAIKYNRSGGAVTVRCTADDGQVAVAVADTGSGIASKDLDRVFTPFDRIGAENSAVEGTGVGLALSQGLAQAMSGHIDVTSVVGEGSTFTLVLPDTADPAPEPRPPVTVAVRSNRLVRVLYIEDNPSNARLMERICSLRENTMLTVCRTGRDGLTQALSTPPDLVLLDLHLPDISGADILAALRRDDRTSTLPVVVLSADAGAAARQVCLELGANAFLPKPLDVTAVLQVINDPTSER